MPYLVVMWGGGGLGLWVTPILGVGARFGKRRVGIIKSR